MSTLRKITTAVRGGAREIGEFVVDANGTRIFEQEVAFAKGHLNKAKHDLMDVMAKQIQACREVESLKQEVADHEGYAEQALYKENETLALEIAEKIASLDRKLTEQQEVCQSFKTQVNRLKKLLKKTARQLKEYERQLTMVKTMESLQKTSAAMTNDFSSPSSSRNLSAKDSLKRIRKRKQDNFHKMEAAELLDSEVSNKALTSKMKEAGIGESGTNANSVLDRIKAKGRIDQWGLFFYRESDV